ncbi:hypothetical protein BS47DRAFT_1363424 [Hydnum rufescens UP504]|uniref:Uncharacterized protein n=1 Tax=Hydnum rufescens UP504 TaxID=1448309 RepID=A0A9P6AU23_9AGAM|nr:hypothetical protein BS47DRAFT_1363424 [Hydnum rufescens UP504]
MASWPSSLALLLVALPCHGLASHYGLASCYSLALAMALSLAMAFLPVASPFPVALPFPMALPLPDFTASGLMAILSPTKDFAHPPSQSLVSYPMLSNAIKPGGAAAMVQKDLRGLKTFG